MDVEAETFLGRSLDQDMDQSSVDDDFGICSDQLKRRWQATQFDQEVKSAAAASSSSANKETSAADSDIRRNWNELVFNSAKSLKNSALSFPWERGLASQVLSGRPLLEHMELKPQQLSTSVFLTTPDPDDPAKAERSAIISRLDQVPGAWKFAAQRLARLTPLVDRAATARSTAVSKWRDIVLVKPEASVLGRTLLADLMAFSSDSHLSTVISDVCSPKATATLSKRGNHILFFVEFCQRLHFEPFSSCGVNLVQVSQRL